MHQKAKRAGRQGGGKYYKRIGKDCSHLQPLNNCGQLGVMELEGKHWSLQSLLDFAILWRSKFWKGLKCKDQERRGIGYWWFHFTFTLALDIQRGASNLHRAVLFPTTYGIASCIVRATLGFFVGGMDIFEGDLGSFFSLDANMRFNSKDE